MTGEPASREAPVVAREDRSEGLAIGQLELDLHEEAVELGLGQGVGALHLDRVLRGDDGEGGSQRARLPVDGDLALGHGLEQRALGPRGGSVDLVSEQHLGEHGPGLELEGARAVLPELQDPRAHHVARHEVRRALDAREVEAQPLARPCTRVVLPRPGRPRAGRGRRSSG